MNPEAEFHNMAPMKRQASALDSATSGTLYLAQVARRWQISQRELRRMLGDQQLSFVQIRGKFRVPVREVKRIERARSTRSGPGRPSRGR